MELIVKEKQFELPAEIINLEELRQALTPKLEFYKTLVVTEDSIRSAKSDKADLNKLKKVIDERRKEIKKAYFEPYQAIESECKQLIALIDDPITAIDDQLKAFDEKDLQVKRAVLEERFQTENTLDFITLEDVLNPKWRNKTEKTDSLKAEISAKLSALKSDFAYIQSMYRSSALRTAVYAKFMETKSKEQTLAYAVELERLEKRLNASVSGSVSGNVITPPTAQTAVTDDFDGSRTVADDSDSSQTVSGSFRVSCTKNQLIALRDFMKSQGIKFEVIREEK